MTHCNSSMSKCKQGITLKKLTDIAGGTPTRGSSKNLFASARAKRLLCMPTNAEGEIKEATLNAGKYTSTSKIQSYLIILLNLFHRKGFFAKLLRLEHFGRKDQ